LLSPYTFTKIADTSDGLGDFGEAPALSNSGAVAFVAHPVASPERACLFTGAGGRPTTIACEHSADVQIGSFPFIDDKNLVAFVLTIGSKQRIVTGDGGPLTTLYETQPASFFTVFDPPALNNAGVVAFHAWTLAWDFQDDVFAGPGGDWVVIDRQDVFDEIRFGTFPSLNRTGTVAYSYSIRSDVYAEDAIKIGDGGEPTTLYSSRDGVFSAFGDPVLNDGGTVAFLASLVSGGSGIFAGDGGPLTTIATTGSTFASFASAPAFNNGGGSAFLARLTAGGDGIFTGPAAAVDKVIATGDVLSGSTVTELHFFRQGLNDAGQVAFFARLDDGTSGIYRADPANQSPRPAHAWAAAEPNPARVEPAALPGIRSGEVSQPVPSGASLLPPPGGQTQVGQGSAVLFSVSPQHRARDAMLVGTHQAPPLEWASGFELEWFGVEFACHWDAG
jgi:hypothetical protein